MKLTKTTKIVLIALVLLTVAAAGLYLTTRRQIPENTLAVEYGSTTYYCDLQGLRLTGIAGERVNGKGEVKPVKGMGVSMHGLLAWTLGPDYTAAQVTVTADDGFSAVVTGEEILEENKVVLLLQEDSTKLQLIVFGDADSKRSVKNVESLLVE